MNRIDINKLKGDLQNTLPNCPVKISDLNKPTSPFVITCFQHVLSQIDSFIQTMYNSDVEWPDFHSDNVENATFYKLIFSFFKKMNIPLYLSDLKDPKVKRTHCLLQFCVHYLCCCVLQIVQKRDFSYILDQDEQLGVLAERKYRGISEGNELARETAEMSEQIKSLKVQIEAERNRNGQLKGAYRQQQAITAAKLKLKEREEKKQLLNQAKLAEAERTLAKRLDLVVEPLNYEIQMKLLTQLKKQDDEHQADLREIEVSVPTDKVNIDRLVNCSVKLAGLNISEECCDNPALGEQLVLKMRDLEIVSKMMSAAQGKKADLEEKNMKLKAESSRLGKVVMKERSRLEAVIAGFDTEQKGWIDEFKAEILRSKNEKQKLREENEEVVDEELEFKRTFEEAYKEILEAHKKVSGVMAETAKLTDNFNNTNSK